MLQVVLYQPEIPPNTGNVMRLCANLGARLHLIEPLGFRLEDRLLRRAGLDYREWVEVAVHPSLEACLDVLDLRTGTRSDPKGADSDGRLFALTTRAARCYAEPHYRCDDCFLFGPETRGLPEAVLNDLPTDHRLRIPMRPGNRSLNLSNAVAVVLYEAWRQQGFAGSDPTSGRPDPAHP